MRRVTFKSLKNNYVLKKKKVKTRWLLGGPQRKADCEAVLKQTPKKPNSAKRSVICLGLKIKRRWKKKKVYVFVPGVKHSISQYHTVLYRGGKAQDLPRIKYKVIRGACKVSGVSGRTKARSKYGVKRRG